MVSHDNSSIEKHSADIIDIAFPNNYGVARTGGLVAFIPGAVVGDHVEFTIVRKAKKHVFGRITRVIRPSSSRVDPVCSHFGECGGCTLQHIEYGKQVELKERYFRETLRRIGAIEPGKIRIRPLVPSPYQFYYRSKLELSCDAGDRGVSLGLKERVAPEEEYSGRVVPVSSCMLFSRNAERVIGYMQERSGDMASLGITGVTLREVKATGEMMAILEVRKGVAKQLDSFSESLANFVPAMISFFYHELPRTDRDSSPGRIIHIRGERTLTETINGISFSIEPLSFTQPNTEAAAILYNEIVTQGEFRGDEHILGLYCGMGPIELIVASQVKRVTGIDSHAGNIENARANCRSNNINNCTFIAGKVEDVISTFRKGAADVIVVDPPRGGLRDTAIKGILAIRPRKILYASCNPATLARDLKKLTESSYAVTTTTPFDFFPQTSHMESLTVLEAVSL